MSKSVIVIGAGIAGLATAIRLQLKGYQVTIFEASNRIGGKLHSRQLGAYRFDMGPSLFTMPQYVDELFELAEQNPREFFNYKKKTNICNYWWEDGTTFSASADKNTFAEEAEKTFGDAAERIENYLQSAEKKYNATNKVFLEKSLHKLDTYLSRDTIKSIFKLGSLGINKTLNELNKDSFENPKLVQLFNRYATYNGSSPYMTPGIMSLIPHLEMSIGTFYPEEACIR